MQNGLEYIRIGNFRIDSEIASNLRKLEEFANVQCENTNGSREKLCAKNREKACSRNTSYSHRKRIEMGSRIYVLLIREVWMQRALEAAATVPAAPWFLYPCPRWRRKVRAVLSRNGHVKMTASDIQRERETSLSFSSDLKKPKLANNTRLLRSDQSLARSSVIYQFAICVRSFVPFIRDI